MNESMIGPLMKRQTLESNWYNVVSGHPSSTPKNLAGTFPSAILGGDGKPIGPLIGGNHRAMFPGGANIPPAYNTNGTNPPATVDWMRQRDEVFSILEDMTKAPPNIPDEGKPYRCTVPGCDKAYKNPNGLKYHNQHGHSSPGLGDADNPEARPYVCNFLECGKRYKNLNGLKYHLEHTHPNMIAALKAHQAALMTNMNPLLADGHHQAAAMTIAAALAAIEASPTMAMASNAILTAHATAAATAAAAAVATSTAPGTVSTLETGPSTANFAPMSDVAEGESAGLVTTGIQNLSAVPVPQTLVGEQ
ncbi:Transcriptional regulator of ribosomal biogenesis proteins [Haplosporangium sp. Z 27]|nr:Transcriptional regulator of ribosomal biogenesis proteins [Haplosporangium sp. Z 27]